MQKYLRHLRPCFRGVPHRSEYFQGVQWRCYRNLNCFPRLIFLICRNFLGPFPPCQKVWCGKCYVPMSGVIFPRRETEEEEDANDDLDPELVMPAAEKDRYQRGRDGDCWVCPFQCELCHFRNVYRRDPVPESRTDSNFVIYCRRANLDAMWARSSATVAKTLRVLFRSQEVATDLFDIPNPFPYREPFPLQDDFGIVAAILFLEESRRPGRNTASVQWDTARGLTSAVTNFYSSGRDSLGAQVASKDSRKLRITLCPTKA